MISPGATVVVDEQADNAGGAANREQRDGVERKTRSGDRSREKRGGGE